MATEKMKKIKGLILVIIALLSILIIVQVNRFEFVEKSGLYDNDFDLSIKYPIGCTVYYTVDGSKPTCENGLVYDKSIRISDASNNANLYSQIKDVSIFLQGVDYGQNVEESYNSYEIPTDSIDKCTVVRAVCVDKNGNEVGDEIIGSYFVGFDDKTGYDDMYFVSIITEPDNLFSYDRGINVMGKGFYESSEDYWRKKEANYNLRGYDSEREVYVQFFLPNGENILSQKCGLRIKGGFSRNLVSKSYNLFAREEYGQNRFNYDFWGNSYIADTISLNSCGQDIKSMLRDKIVNDLARQGGCEFLTAHYIPCVLFVNGEYFGLRYISEKINENYIDKCYGLNDEKLVAVKDGKLEIGDLEIDNDSLRRMWSVTYEECPNDNLIYSVYDKDNLIDYFSTQFYIGRHGDWPVTNIEMWTSRDSGGGYYSDGKWRFILYDLYAGSMVQTCIDENPIEAAKVYFPLLDNLYMDENFRNEIGNRMEDISELYFSDDIIDEYIDAYIDSMREPMLLNYKRFYGDNFNENTFVSECEEVRDFFHERKKFLEENDFFRINN